jgi:hypothetical protein
MKKIDTLALTTRIKAVVPTLNEYQRRRYLSAEAKSIGRGGISLVSRVSGVSRQTLTDGLKELADTTASPMEQGRSRKAGGGRKPVWEAQPEILDALENLVNAHTKGDPESTLLWTNKSLRNLESGLMSIGYRASYRVVGVMLKMLGYSLQADKKTLCVTPSHKDRNEQFEYINKRCNSALADGSPVISVDAKKKEKIGNFKNSGKVYRESKTPIEVLDHDFPIEELGKATPFGIYNIFQNQGFVNVGLSSDTAAFAVESVRRWWYAEGATVYAKAPMIAITADCGGSNGYRNRLWKLELQCLANEIGKPIRVFHYPPGTSKWNKIEHRLFSFITKNWQGIPLVSSAVIVSLIGSTKTEKGLTVRCILDENIYESGRKVSDDEFNAVNICRDDFHGEWNYVISPTVK